MSRGSPQLLVLTDPKPNNALLARDTAHATTTRHHPPRRRTRDTAEELVDTFTRSGAKHLTHTIDPHVDARRALARRPLTQLEARLILCRHTERIATEPLGVDADRTPPTRSPPRHTSPPTSPSGTSKPSDRHNVGTVVGLDDTAGQILVGFVSADGHCAERSLAWQEIEILDPHAKPAGCPTPRASASRNSTGQPTPH